MVCHVNFQVHSKVVGFKYANAMTAELDSVLFRSKKQWSDKTLFLVYLFFWDGVTAAQHTKLGSLAARTI